MLRRLAVPLVIALLMVACTPEQGPAKLSISSRAPAAGAANVAVDSVVSVTFNTAIKPASLDGNFGLAQGGTAVPGVVSYDSASRKATFTPNTPLANGAEYTASVGAGVQSAQGVKLGTKSAWVFTTVAADSSVSSVTIVGGDRSVAVGGTVTLEATVDVVGAADTSVVWSSDDATVATVDAAGVVTGVAVGSANVTATSVADGEKQDSVVITVTAAAAVTGIAIDQVDPATTVGGTVALSATVTVEGGASDAVTWSSDDETIATVDVAGVVTGVTAGTVSITATSEADPSFSDSVDVVVAVPLSFGADYATLVGVASVDGPISVAAPAPASAGYGDLTYALTAGALPDAFVVDDGVNPAESFEVTLDPATGEISGATGYPGVYTGTVTVTDSLGQTAELDFTINLGLSLQVFNSEGDAPQGTFTYSNVSTTVVPGDRIRVSGVVNSEWLPADFAGQLEFDLDFLSADPVQNQAAADEAFEVNTAQGTVSRGETPTTGDDIRWSFELALTYGSITTSVPLVFQGVNY